jgi:hypothetical protein
MIADFDVSSPCGKNVDVNIARYALPLFNAEASSPMGTMMCDIGGMGFTGSNGSNASAMIPMPAGAAPDPMSDHHLLIVDRANQTEWGMWNTTNNNGQWHCGLGASIDLNGTGVRPIAQGNSTWYIARPARMRLRSRRRADSARGDPGGRDRARAGDRLSHIRAGLCTPPASTAQAHVGTNAIMTRGIPCGGRMQLNPGIDVNSLGLSASGRIIVTRCRSTVLCRRLFRRNQHLRRKRLRRAKLLVGRAQH